MGDGAVLERGAQQVGQRDAEGHRAGAGPPGAALIGAVANARS